MLHQVTHSFELADGLATLYRALTFAEIETNTYLQVFKLKNSMPLTHLSGDVLVAIEVKFHDYLLDERLIWDASA